jgi:hypothetical protein
MLDLILQHTDDGSLHWAWIIVVTAVNTQTSAMSCEFLHIPYPKPNRIKNPANSMKR